MSGMKVSKQKKVTGTSLPENFYDSNFKTLSIQAIYQLTVTDDGSGGARSSVEHGRDKVPMFISYIKDSTSSNYYRASEYAWQGATAGNHVHVYADDLNIYLDSNFVDDFFFPIGQVTIDAFVFVFTNDLD